MGYQPLEELLPKAGGSVYKLVRLAGKRATEIADGKKKLIDDHPDTKTTTTALDEIRASMVVLKDVADQYKPSEKPVQKIETEETEQST